MAKVSGLLARVGVHQARGGVYHATPERFRNHVRQFQAMKAAGHKVPVCWGHQPGAKPATAAERAELEYWKSKFNAGHLEDLRFDEAKGEMHFAADVPGAERDAQGRLVTWTRLPDGREVQSAISEVSAAIHNFTAGDAREYPDAVTHVALCVLPIIADQPPLNAAELSADIGEPLYLAASTFLYELGSAPVADEKLPEKPAETTTPEKPAEAPPAAPTVDPKDAQFQDALAALRELGLGLPDDTTKDNFFERVVVAAHAMAHKETMEGEENGDAGTEAGGGGGQVQEERPMMMSLATATDPVIRTFLGREQDAHRKKQLDAITKLRDTGKMPVVDFNRLKEALDGYELSATVEGERVEQVQQDVDKEISMWLSVCSKVPTGLLRGKLGKVKEATRPIESSDEQKRQAAEKAGEELASRV